VRRVTASAPGKLFLAGEYAVLAGAPALVAAVDRHAHVRAVLEPGAGALDVESLAEGTRRVIHDPGRDALGGGDAGAVLAALRIARTAAPSLAAMRARVVVDTRAFLADGQKLGLGRSAATVAAAVAALLAGVGRQDRDEILQAALAAHALFQEGRGSGADVAAAVRGGVLEFRRDGGEVTVAARALPRGLHLLVGWTGEGGATDPMLRRFADGASRPRALRDLSVAAEYIKYKPSRVPSFTTNGKEGYLKHFGMAGGHRLLVTGMVFTNPDGKRFLVESGAAYDPIENILHGLLVTLGIYMPLAVSLAIVGGYWLMRRSLRPVDEITKRAQGITSTNLSERLPIIKTGDELERLSTALNHMIARLDDAVVGATVRLRCCTRRC